MLNPPAIPRRKFQRRIAKTNAFVHCRGSFLAATIVDYSEGGLQLEGTFALLRGDDIEVELISGTRISGKVAWSYGSQTGMVFNETLPIHRALMELSQRRVQPSGP